MPTPTTRTTQSPSRRKIARYVLFGTVSFVLVLGVATAPGRERARPVNDDFVLTHVPARHTAEGAARETLRQEAVRAPGDLRRALALAQSYIEASRHEGDPRELGAAEAALAPWTAAPNPPPEVLLLRATILQSRHAFDAALADLDRALAQRPDDAQAWLTRATVWTVKGGYEQARASCQRLAPLVSPALAVACRAPIDALTGRGAEARAALERALVSAHLPAEQTYLHSLLGEQAFWRGELARSELHLRATLALDPGDRYTRALYADLLLDAGRAREVELLTRGHEGDDALTLRRALADLTLGRRDARSVEQLAAGFGESRLRGDAVHQREEARLWLARGEAPRALALARESWAVQREPWDARLVLEAASAVGDRAAAEPVLAWLDVTHFEAPKLARLVARLRGQP